MILLVSVLTQWARRVLPALLLELSAGEKKGGEIIFSDAFPISQHADHRKLIHRCLQDGPLAYLREDHRPEVKKMKTPGEAHRVVSQTLTGCPLQSVDFCFLSY